MAIPSCAPMREELRSLGFGVSGTKAELWARLQDARAALAAEVPGLSVCLCTVPTVETLPGYGEQCLASDCLCYVQWPDRLERPVAVCSADDATCNVMEELALELCATCQRQYHVGDQCNAMEWGWNKKKHLHKFCSDCAQDWKNRAENAAATLAARAAATSAE